MKFTVQAVTAADSGIQRRLRGVLEDPRSEKFLSDLATKYSLAAALCKPAQKAALLGMKFKMQAILKEMEGAKASGVERVLA